MTMQDGSDTENIWQNAYEKGDVPPILVNGPEPKPVSIGVEEGHRVKYPDFHVPFNCCVAEPVS